MAARENPKEVLMKEILELNMEIGEMNTIHTIDRNIEQTISKLNSLLKPIKSAQLSLNLTLSNELYNDTFYEIAKHINENFYHICFCRWNVSIPGFGN